MSPAKPNERAAVEGTRLMKSWAMPSVAQHARGAASGLRNSEIPGLDLPALMMRHFSGARLADREPVVWARVAGESSS
jgi:hypothetical protein